MRQPQPARIRRIRRNRRIVGSVLAATALLGACTNDADDAAAPPLDVELVAALQPFDRCDDFLSHVKGLARDRVTAYGFGGGMYYGDAMPSAADVGTSSRAAAEGTEGGSDGAAPATSAAAPAEDGISEVAGSDDAAKDAGTGTNNQEADVDEADLVKIDGDRIVTVRGNELIVVTTVAGAPYVTGRVSLGESFNGDRLFLLDDRAYVLGWDGGSVGTDTATTRRFAASGAGAIVEVSLGADGPAVAHRAVVAGTILDGRLVGTTMRLVVTSPGGTGLGFVYPDGSNGDAEDRALDVNRSIVDDSEIEDWLPMATVDGDERQLVECDDTYRPAEPSGLSVLSIVTVADGLESMTGTGVLADGQITYASADHLYVATNQWAVDEPTGDTGSESDSAVTTTAEHTDVHSFSIDGSAPAGYEASGRVEGHVLNQYSMSESGDDLRIATTVSGAGGIVTPMPMPIDCPPDAVCAATEPAVTEPAVTEPAAAQAGDSRIVVLRRDGEVLTEIGKVDGLGVSEQIKSVRYVGDLAYVVTFRRTDPFYVVDLSDPTAPRTLGELKVPGFSSYLHPVGTNLVLGVGSDATNEGRVQGGKVSLYDTSDPTAPREITSLVTRTADFLVASDPHAFSWDAARSTAYLPYSTACYDTFEVAADCAVGSNGVLVLRVADGAITEIGRITHDDRTPSPTPPLTESTTTTAPDSTTVPETTTTTEPAGTTTTEPTAETTIATTVPTTVVGNESDDTSTRPSDPAAGTAPVPDVVCAPEFCDPGPYPPYLDISISRVFVVGDRVVTLSHTGVAMHRVDDLGPTGYAAF